ncbi:MAG: FecR domain-containing protein [Bacteroidales bacterium]
MDKKLLLKYVANEATKEEQVKVLDWMEKRAENKQYLISLKLSYIATTGPKERASEQEMTRMRETIMRGQFTDHKLNMTTNPHAAATGDASLEVSSGKTSQGDQFPGKSPQETGTSFYKILSAITSVAAVIAVMGLILKPSVNSEKNILRIKEKIVAELKQEQIRIKLAEIPAEKLHTIYTEKGVKSTVQLPDGSTVQLNSDTKVTFPDNFVGDTREVELSGEAYFKVQSDSSKPMIVNTNKGFQIKVLGTEFNVRSYDNDNTAQATLYEGSIHLITPTATTVVKPNEQAVIEPNKVVKLVVPSVIADTKAWTEGRLVFEETKMSEVVKMLERWHGVKMIVKDPKILNYTITANFNSESIYQIMYIIKSCSLVDYKIAENVVTLSSR